ncbi:ankyrin repeat-containing protein [Hyphomonas adhaerens MHS-3]|uniref:Ankyrin repeat-containing protein n=1 Tax=Hyphomonas adhaerens MHS-3 TaxID=1280949 RepID=A0A069E6B6_9PROT|nr:ankyrin repeat domain-containing protein [Hyphomonas adhaerens]KCZ85825.1 ankyrin repeat-containing protein [Hyphomonas adhaerens MHS-3]
MKTIRGALTAGLLALATVSAHAEAEPEPPPRETGWNIAPFQPHLTRNDAPELCQPFAAAWTDLFGAAGRLDSADLDLSAIPHEAVFAFPETVRSGRAARTQTLYGQTFEARHDLDGDGDEEVLFVVSYDRGWRYRGAGLYLFDTVADFEAMQAQYPERYGEISFTYNWNELAAEVTGGPVASFGRLHRVQLFLHEGVLYTVSDGRGVSRGQQSKRESVRRIWPAEEAETVCELQIRPGPEQFEPFISASPFYQALKAMYAGPGANQGGRCHANRGWVGVPPDAILPDLFHRPQAWPEPNGRFEPEEERQDDVAREVRPLSWGTSDPSGWQTYLSLKADQPEFLRRMEEYYAERFAMPPEQAKAEALQAWRALVDRVFYSRNNDMALAVLVPPFYIAHPTSDPVDFDWDAPLDEILDEVIAGVRNSAAPLWQSGPVNGAAIAAAIYVNRPTEEIRELYNLVLPAAGPPATEREQKRQWYAKRALHVAILPAAVTRPDVLAMLLSEGAPPDDATNSFRKTALMYAAQENQPDSARLLLAAGADVNQTTDDSPYQTGFLTCVELQRDHRTALMYAAENASEELISLMLDAGADPAAEDTEGNSASWYLARNTKLADEARSRLETRLAVE